MRVLVHLACGFLLTASLSGCAYLPLPGIGGENDPLREARRLLLEGDYAAAEETIREALETRRDIARDRAWWLAAIAAGHPDNANRDTALARRYLSQIPEGTGGAGMPLDVMVLERLLEETDRADRAEMAAMAERTERMQAAEQAERTRRPAPVEKPPGQENGDEIGECAELREALAATRIRLFRARERIEEMKRRTEQMKQIDLEVEQKKRKTLRSEPKEGAEETPRDE